MSSRLTDLETRLTGLETRFGTEFSELRSSLTEINKMITEIAESNSDSNSRISELERIFPKVDNLEERIVKIDNGNQ